MRTQTLLVDDQKTSPSEPKISCLVLSPAVVFGSWGWLSDVMRYSPEHLTYEVVAFGTPETIPPGVTMHSLKDRDYLERGPKMAERRYFIMNGLQYLPMLPKLFSVMRKTRPKHMMANGIAGAAVLLPYKWLFRAKLHLAYHGYIAHMGPRWHRAIRFVLGQCDQIFVNSRGSEDDLALVTNRDHITTIEHWADPIFFKRPLNKERSPGPLRVMYVGRLHEDKFGQAHRVLNALSAEGVVQFWLVGDGPMAHAARSIPGMVDNGYVSDQSKLAEIYQSVDVVWAPADVTYLSRPGIEALASGTPVICPDVVPIQGRTATERVPKSLIPKDCGWVFDGEEDSEVEALLRSLNSSLETDSMHEACRTHAAKCHSVQNIQAVTDRLT